MGLYDREYSREPQSGYQLNAPQSATMQLLIITVVVYAVQLLFVESTGYLQLMADWYRRPWEAYRLLTYGFAHAPNDIKHILFNMIVLGMFGRPVEERYGRTKFLTFYLAAIIIGGLGWSLVQALMNEPAVMYGASAAVTGVFILFAFNFPHAEIRLFFLFPMPAWVAALIGVISDVHGAITMCGPVAFTAHLSGALFGYVFYRYGWLPGTNLVGWAGSRRLRPRTRLRVHQPDDEQEAEQDDLARQVDAILEKIQQKGQGSLSKSERRLLEEASRRYQEKRR